MNQLPNLCELRKTLTYPNEINRNGISYQKAITIETTDLRLESFDGIPTSNGYSTKCFV